MAHEKCKQCKEECECEEKVEIFRKMWEAGEWSDVMLNGKSCRIAARRILLSVNSSFAKNILDKDSDDEDSDDDYDCDISDCNDDNLQSTSGDIPMPACDPEQILNNSASGRGGGGGGSVGGGSTSSGYCGSDGSGDMEEKKKSTQVKKLLDVQTEPVPSTSTIEMFCYSAVGGAPSTPGMSSVGASPVSKSSMKKSIPSTSSVGPSSVVESENKESTRGKSSVGPSSVKKSRKKQRDSSVFYGGRSMRRISRKKSQRKRRY